MAILEIPLINPIPTANPQSAHPGLNSMQGGSSNHREITASKKVDDLSRHESKHDSAPKHPPKLNPRDKGYEGPRPGSTPLSDGKAPVGTVKT